MHGPVLHVLRGGILLALGPLGDKISYDFPRVNLYLRANNVLDRTWYDFGDIPQPGFWVMAGIACKLPR